MTEARSAAKKALEQSNDTMKQQFDKKRWPSHPYKEGDLVWIEASNISTQQPSKKLDAKHHGPFKIIKKEGQSAYCLDIPRTWRAIHPVFNELLIMPYRKPEFAIRKKPLPPPPEVIRSEPEY